MKGLVFHVMNRGAKRTRIFETDADYWSFVRLMAEAQTIVPLPICTYCLMPNHFHLVVRPSEDHELSAFMHRLTSTHARRWNVFRSLVGVGAVYQSRFKSFPVQNDHHFLVVCRYVEQNALRAGLVARAEDWNWSGLADRCKNRHILRSAEWPIPQPSNWLDLVNVVPASADLVALRKSVRRGSPFGSRLWAATAADTLKIKERDHPIGRPRS